MTFPAKFSFHKKTAQKSWLGVFSLAFLLSSFSPTMAAENQITYKIKLGEQSSGDASIFNFNGVDTAEEFVVIKVTGKQFKIYHTTHVVNKSWFTNRWFDHPVTAMKICVTDGFEKKDCNVVNSDTSTIPEKLTISDLSIDFKYTESDRSLTRNIVVAKDAKPEK
jgi:hypothetical protein